MNWTRAVLSALIGLISSMLGAYFIWIGIEVNAIGKRMERMDVRIEQFMGRPSD